MLYRLSAARPRLHTQDHRAIEFVAVDVDCVDVDAVDPCARPRQRDVERDPSVVSDPGQGLSRPNQRESAVRSLAIDRHREADLRACSRARLELERGEADEWIL